MNQAYLCFCSNIFSRAFTSTLSNPEKIPIQCLAITLTENSRGNSDPHRTDSIISDLQKNLKGETPVIRTLTLQKTHRKLILYLKKFAGT